MDRIKVGVAGQPDLAEHVGRFARSSSDLNHDVRVVSRILW